MHLDYSHISQSWVSVRARTSCRAKWIQVSFHLRLHFCLYLCFLSVVICVFRYPCMCLFLLYRAFSSNSTADTLIGQLQDKIDAGGENLDEILNEHLENELGGKFGKKKKQSIATAEDDHVGMVGAGNSASKFSAIAELLKAKRERTKLVMNERVETYGYLFRGLRVKFYYYRICSFILNLALAIFTVFIKDEDLKLFVSGLLFTVNFAGALSMLPFVSVFNNILFIGLAFVSLAHTVTLLGVDGYVNNDKDRDRARIYFYSLLCAIIISFIVIVLVRPKARKLLQIVLKKKFASTQSNTNKQSMNSMSSITPTKGAVAVLPSSPTNKLSAGITAGGSAHTSSNGSNGSNPLKTLATEFDAEYSMGDSHKFDDLDETEKKIDHEIKARQDKELRMQREEELREKKAKEELEAAKLAAEQVAANEILPTPRQNAVIVPKRSSQSLAARLLPAVPTTAALPPPLSRVKSPPPATIPELTRAPSIEEIPSIDDQMSAPVDNSEAPKVERQLSSHPSHSSSNSNSGPRRLSNSSSFPNLRTLITAPSMSNLNKSPEPVRAPYIAPPSLAVPSRPWAPPSLRAKTDEQLNAKSAPVSRSPSGSPRVSPGLTPANGNTPRLSPNPSPKVLPLPTFNGRPLPRTSVLTRMIPVTSVPTTPKSNAGYASGYSTNSTNSTAASRSHSPLPFLDVNGAAPPSPSAGGDGRRYTRMMPAPLHINDSPRTDEGPLESPITIQPMLPGYSQQHHRPGQLLLPSAPRMLDVGDYVVPVRNTSDALSAPRTPTRSRAISGAATPKLGAMGSTTPKQGPHHGRSGSTTPMFTSRSGAATPKYGAVKPIVPSASPLMSPHGLQPSPSPLASPAASGAATPVLALTPINRRSPNASGSTTPVGRAPQKLSHAFPVSTTALFPGSIVQLQSYDGNDGDPFVPTSLSSSTPSGVASPTTVRSPPRGSPPAATPSGTLSPRSVHTLDSPGRAGIGFLSYPNSKMLPPPPKLSNAAPRMPSIIQTSAAQGSNVLRSISNPRAVIGRVVSGGNSSVSSRVASSNSSEGNSGVQSNLISGPTSGAATPHSVSRVNTFGRQFGS